MRTRKKKWAGEELRTNPLIVAIPEKVNCGEAKSGYFTALFGNDRLSSLEIGCGKGKFICEMAANYPDRNFVAIERAPKILAFCSRLARLVGLNNVLFVHTDAERLNEIFNEAEVAEIFINFCDPWPKNHNKYAKRRLTHGNFLDIYHRILIPRGSILFKTDNPALFRFTIAEFAARGEAWELVRATEDLHTEDYAAELVKTEYEERFIAKGQPIYFIEARKLT